MRKIMNGQMLAEGWEVITQARRVKELFFAGDLADDLVGGETLTEDEATVLNDLRHVIEGSLLEDIQEEE